MQRLCAYDDRWLVLACTDVLYLVDLHSTEEQTMCHFVAGTQRGLHDSLDAKVVDGDGTLTDAKTILIAALHRVFEVSLNVSTGSVQNISIRVVLHAERPEFAAELPDEFAAISICAHNKKIFVGQPRSVLWYHPESNISRTLLHCEEWDPNVSSVLGLAMIPDCGRAGVLLVMSSELDPFIAIDVATERYTVLNFSGVNPSSDKPFSLSSSSADQLLTCDCDA